METFFPKCRPLLEETSRTTPTKARNNAKNNSHDNNNTTTTSSAVPFSDTLLLCAVRLFFSKAFVLHQRVVLLLRVVFLVSRRPFGGHCTNDTKLHNTTHLVCFQKNDANVSLSLCVPSRTTGRGGVFVGEKFFRFKKKLFRRKGKRTIKERNASRVTCSNENVNAKKKP